MSLHKFDFYPARACAARGYVIALGLDYIVSAKKFQSSKNTHFQKFISTQEGFSSNSMASSTAYELGKSSWPSQILLVCCLGNVCASDDADPVTRSKPRLNTPTRSSSSSS